MKLHRVAKRFNDTPCRDAYTGELLFKGQLGVYTEAVRDGITTQRRVLELAPDTELPPRGVIEFEGENWILGGGNIDTFKGTTIREKFPIHESKGLANVMNPLQFLEGEDGTLAHAGFVFVKTNKEVEESSNEFNQSTMYFSMSEQIKAHQIITQNDRTYIVKETYPATAGHLGVIVEEIDEPALEVVETKGRRNPITEQYEEGQKITIARLRWQTDFQYFSKMTPTFTRGDIQVITATTNAMKVGDKLTLRDGVWMVISRDIRDEVQYLHLRRDK